MLFKKSSPQDFTTFLNKNFINIVKITLTIEVIVLGLACFKHIISPDEIEFLRSGWLLSQGQAPYTGFLENHHPLYFYIIAPFFKIFSDPINACMAIRALTCTFFFITLFGVFNIGRLLYNLEVGLFAAALVPSWFMTSRIVFETRPDIPQVTCAIWSIYFLIKAIKNKKPIFAFLSGIFFSFAFLFLQKAILLISILGAVLLLETYLTPLSLSFLIMFAIGIISTLGPYYLYLWKTDQLLRYWQLCYTFNQHIFQKSLSNMISLIGSFRFIFSHSVYIDRILWAFVLLGLFSAKKLRPLLPVLGATLIGILWTEVYHGPQYNLLYAPFASIIAALGLYCFSKKSKPITILFFLTCLYPLHFHVCTLIFSKSTCQIQKEEARYCSQFLTKTDHVAIGNYHLLFYHDSHPVWYLYSGLKTPYEKSTGETVYSWLEGIKKHRPVFIGERVACYDNLNQANYFKENYTQLKQYSSLYIRNDKLKNV